MARTPKPPKPPKAPKAPKAPKGVKKESMAKSAGVKKAATSTTKKPRVARQHSAQARHPSNYTAFHPDQAHWSINNMPDILYQYRPLEKDINYEPVDENGKWLYGQQLRVLPILPDHISSDVEEWRCEAWQRLDSRITLKDIVARMHPNFRIRPNALQQRNGRFRTKFHMVAWHSSNKRSDKLDDDLEKELIKAGIDPALNTTRGLTPGLINPALGEAGGRIPIPAKEPAGRPKKNKKKKNTAIEHHLQRQDTLELTAHAQNNAPVVQNSAGQGANVQMPTPYQSQANSPAQGSNFQVSTPYASQTNSPILQAAGHGNAQMPTPYQSQYNSPVAHRSNFQESTPYQQTNSPVTYSTGKATNVQMPASSTPQFKAPLVYGSAGMGTDIQIPTAFYDAQNDTYQFVPVPDDGMMNLQMNNFFSLPEIDFDVPNGDDLTESEKKILAETPTDGESIPFGESAYVQLPISYSETQTTQVTQGSSGEITDAQSPASYSETQINAQVAQGSSGEITDTQSPVPSSETQTTAQLAQESPSEVTDAQSPVSSSETQTNTQDAQDDFVLWYQAECDPGSFERMTMPELDAFDW